MPDSARRKRKKATGKFLGGFGMELRGMSVGELGSLFGHRLANLWDAVTNGDDGSSAGGIEIALASCGEDKTSFAAYRLRVRLQEISRKDGVTHCCFLN
jgi:hypothetical protein